MTILRTLASLSLAGIVAAAQTPKPAAGGVIACSEGAGTVHLLWSPDPDRIPEGGWQVQDDRGRVLDRLPIGDESRLSGLPKAKQDQVRSLWKGFREARNPEERKIVLLAAFVEAGQSLEVGHALGLAATLRDQPGSRQTYTVVGLDRAGHPGAVRFVSAPVDPGQASPLPPVVPSLAATPGRTGVALTWSPVAKPPLPVMAYRVTRDGAALLQAPLILGASWKGSGSQFLDREAPVEAEHTYEVAALDLFGRSGPASTVRIFVPDPAALEAPGSFRAEAQPGRNVLTWGASGSRYCTGFLVERSHLRQGPWEPLSPKPLPAATLRFEDQGVTAGSLYYYRIRSLNSRSETGEPSGVAFAQAKAGEKLAPPAGLAVEDGATRVRLTWKPALRPIAGYLVERRVGADNVWARLNATLLGTTRYDDCLGETASGGYQYRVTAVDFDNSTASSEPVSVVREDRTPPPAPHLLQASGNFGKVQLRFRPAPPAERTAGFLVLRTLLGTEDEMVVSEVLPATATEFTDPAVRSGLGYSYRVMAVGVNALRSEGSTALEVLVGAPAVEAPPRPGTAFVEKPFRRVVLTFPAPPGNLVYFLHRKTPDRREWLQIQGPLSGGEARDVNPPRSGKVLYRLYARSVDGTAGHAGESVELTLPES